MGVNKAVWSNKEMLKRLSFTCKHRHNGIDHATCYDKYHGTIEKIAFLDIEASNLTASFGICYTYCIANNIDKTIIKRAVTIEELQSGKFDKELLKDLIKDIMKFDRVVAHYGAKNRSFDLPFLRTRCVYWRLQFPRYKELWASDTHTILRNKFKLHSNRLEAACDFYNIPSKAHKLNPTIWLNMITGNKKLMQKSINYILKHNEEDVISLRDLWVKINKYVAVTKTSI